jgi:long-chain fatty acid transport protein
MLVCDPYTGSGAMRKFLLLLNLFVLYGSAYGTLAGGRPNAFSEGLNAFAGVINPANAVWIADRLDVGAFWVHQKSSLTNHDNNPQFPPGKLDLTYRARNLFTVDAAIHKQLKLQMGCETFDGSVSLATYTMPTNSKVRTKVPIALIGTTPIYVRDKTNVISAVFSLKLNASHSVGISVDYFYLSHNREGFQNSDTPLRSVSPGHVTNRGTDHSHGFGCTLGWRWKITDHLNFGIAWSRKSACGQFRKYRGYEPHHAKNYTPQLLGAGFSYRFTSKIAGRAEVLWSNLSNLPNANNAVLPDGSLNTHKRGSTKSPGPGLQDAIYINVGMGYQVNSMLSVGAGLSHRIKFHRKSALIIAHSYMLQTIYDVLSLGANFNYQKHNLFLVLSYGFRNNDSGLMPKQFGGGRFSGGKQNASLSFSWGYQY